jgi:hypothetical protein
VSIWSDIEQALNPLSGVDKLAGAVEGVWATVTDYKMWRSLGWLILGIALMLMGVAFWIGPSAARRSPLGLAAEGLG